MTETTFLLCFISGTLLEYKTPNFKELSNVQTCSPLPPMLASQHCVKCFIVTEKQSHSCAGAVQVLRVHGEIQQKAATRVSALCPTLMSLVDGWMLSGTQWVFSP